MSAVTVGRIGERLVAVKRADNDAGAALRSEAQILELLDHPGLVQLIDVDDSDGAVVMRTAFAGSDTWASCPVEDPVERAAGIAAIAATLADMHARGVTHGALHADHVIRGDHDRPILCGLSRCGGDTDTERYADLAALAELIDEPPLGAGPVTAALTTLAQRTRSALCDAADVVQTANRIVAHAGPDNSTKAGPRRRRLITVAVVLAATVAGGTIAVAAASQRGGQRATPAAEPPSRARAAPPLASPSSQPGPGVIIDHEGRRYVVGHEKDVVVLGDWNCDRDPTPAVLRPGTGEIAVFERWPDPDRTVSVSTSWVIATAHDLSAEAQAGCDRLRVHTAAGSRLLAAGDVG